MPGWLQACDGGHSAPRTCACHMCTTGNVPVKTMRACGRMGSQAIALLAHLPNIQSPPSHAQKRTLPKHPESKIESYTAARLSCMLGRRPPTL